VIAAELQSAWAQGLRSRDKVERERALEAVCAAFHRPLFQLALRITCNAADAEDALQETWFDLARGIDGFRAEAKLSTWLFRIAIRHAARIKSRRHSRATLELDEARTVPGGKDPAQAAEELDGARRLLGAIAKLSLEQRVVLGLAVGDELPYAEIASILGVPEGTVSSRLNAAREGLRARLERR
jgi:RNA polymerase sigma-70 factor (ECF subfamily)